MLVKLNTWPKDLERWYRLNVDPVPETITSIFGTHLVDPIELEPGAGLYVEPEGDAWKLTITAAPPNPRSTRR